MFGGIFWNFKKYPKIVKTEREISSIKQNYIGLMQKKQQKNLSLEQKENIRFQVIEETAKLEINQNRHDLLKKRQREMIK